jgi:hypothetical protein
MARSALSPSMRTIRPTLKWGMIPRRSQYLTVCTEIPRLLAQLAGRSYFFWIGGETVRFIWMNNKSKNFRGAQADRIFADVVFKRLGGLKCLPKSGLEITFEIYVRENSMWTKYRGLFGFFGWLFGSKNAVWERSEKNFFGGDFGQSLLGKDSRK